MRGSSEGFKRGVSSLRFAFSRSLVSPPRSLPRISLDSSHERARFTAVSSSFLLTIPVLLFVASLIIGSNHLLIGQIGRASGPLLFCSLYWWAGRTTAYSVGCAGMVVVCALSWGVLRLPEGATWEKPGRKGKVEKKA